MIAAQLDGAATGISDADEWTLRTAVGRVDAEELVSSSGATEGRPPDEVPASLQF